MKTIVYARQSVDKKDSVSIEAQIESCARRIDGEYEVYQDKGWSGKTTDRPMMKQLIQNVEQGNVSKIVVYKMDRISRNIVDFANLISLFEKHNVEFISATEQFDTSTPVGKSMIYIVMIFAQMERETIANRIKDNYYFRAKTGRYFMGGNTPYGYTSNRVMIDGKHISVLVVNETRDILLRIFEQFTEGRSMMSIAKALNEEGIMTSKGKPWSSKAIHTILKNITPVVADKRLYDYLQTTGYQIESGEEDFVGVTGTCRFLKYHDKNVINEEEKQIIAVGSHEPIISSDLFIQAQNILELNKTRNTKKNSKRSPLAGLIKCKCCNYSFGLKYTKRGDVSYSYYYCRGRADKGNSVCQNEGYIAADELENAVVEECRRYLKQNSIPKSVIVSEKAEENTKEIAMLEQQINNLVENIALGTSRVSELLNKKIIELEMQIEQLKKTERYIPVKALKSEQMIEAIDRLDQFESFTIEQKTELLRQLIDTIEVDQDKTIYINYLF